MKQLTLTLYVSPSLAVLAGRAQMGEHRVTLGDEDLAALTDSQRDALAKHVGGDPYYCLDARVPDASMTSIAFAIDEMAERAAKRMADRATEIRKWLEDANATMRAWLKNPAAQSKEATRIESEVLGCATEAVYVDGWPKLPHLAEYKRPAAGEPLPADLADEHAALLSRVEALAADMRDAWKIAAPGEAATQIEEIRAKRAAKAAAKAAVEAERQALIAEFPAPLRAQHEAGYLGAHDLACALDLVAAARWGIEDMIDADANPDDYNRPDDVQPHTWLDYEEKLKDLPEDLRDLAALEKFDGGYAMIVRLPVAGGIPVVIPL